ncbi:FAD-dependent oxidoreductase [Aquabacter spiritensis]|uniref:2-polyprenyl-6-methoxyphenol hydroxylase-like FAD-dependent oxidoreductase n=1 Tax=Aquabacter spiritensis TaxID=933073 RepID=A0A4R3LUI9_9HYPH|nr:FAD-dependent oxidoreductase [Aquabacter spiritensis]TCT02047.1 2-polyprenyl-6-methoxyphenol hydroxylase-like FAD-dependent oxidoreductase [Aquabacter spiritensis]
MPEVMKTDVLIVGGGPVGATLAIDLAQRGVSVIVLEMRHRGEPPSVKCNHVSARSMELFRRLGLAGKLRDAGLPADYPNDVAYRTTMVGRELTRIPIPCRRDRFSATGGPDTWWPTPEPPHRINQIYLEPILVEAAAATPGVTLLNRVMFDRLIAADDHVDVEAHELDGGGPLRIQARYMVGCDGGRSEVRRQIGAKLQGDAVVQRVQSTFIRAPKLIDMLTTAPAWGNFSLNPRRSGNVYAIDGRETWLVHNYLRQSEPDFDSVDRDAALRQILGVGADFSYEVMGNEDWFGRRLVVDKMREGRVFVCGDAAHLWVPYAGYGMNAGLADAANLAWMLAAVVTGWGDEALLDAHARERHPITEQVSHYAMNHAEQMARQRGGVPENIEEESPEGAAARAEIGQSAYDLNVQQYCCGGLNFGYFYDNSPIIYYDGEQAPSYSMANFTPSTVPGCRTPHVFLPGGRSLYDAMGSDHVLLRFDPEVEVNNLVQAARARALPMKVLDVPKTKDCEVFEHKLVLSRPDQHVAWRGDAPPGDALALVDHLRGAGASRH